MLHFLRHIRQKLILQENVRKYLLYAVGEILLVVIGILIALQVNNWNQQQQENKLLWGYLQNIHSNIEADLKEARELNYVYDQIESGTRRIVSISQKERINIRERDALGAHYNTITGIGVFSANKSGFEALKSTGAIANIQGTHMEELLNVYYDRATIIEEELRRDRDIRDDAVKEYNKMEWGFNFSDFYLQNDTIAFYGYQDEFLKMINSSIIQSVFSNGYYNNFDEYFTTIDRIGSIIIFMLEQEELFTTEENMRLVSFLDMDLSNDGIEDVVVNGSYPTSLLLITESNLGEGGILEQINSAYLTIKFEEDIEWGAAIFVVDTMGIGDTRPSKDFSKFTAVEMELRGDQSDQEILFSIKDRLDPDDGMETRAPIILSQEWNTYRFALEDFTTADLKTLNAVAIFVALSGEPITMDIKNIRYIREE